MASPVGTLRVDLSANTAQFAAGMDAARAKIAQFQGAGMKASASAKALGSEFSRMGRSISGNRFAIQNAAYQVGDFAVQVAGGTSATRALAQQLPQLLGGFGVFGAVAGAAFAILGPLVGKLFEGADASSEFARELEGINPSLQSVRSGITELRDLQQSYVDAIRQAGQATTGAAALTVANTKREFEARKQLLAVELEILRIRNQEKASDITNLQSQVDAAAAGLQNDIAQIKSDFETGGRSFGNAGRFGREDPVVIAAQEQFIQRTKETQLIIRKLRGELNLSEIAAEELAAALDTTFNDVGGAGGGETGGGGGGGGGGSPRSRQIDKTAESLKNLQGELDKVNEQIRDTRDQFKDFFGSIIDGSKSAKEALSDLLAGFASDLFSSGFDSLWGAIFPGVTANAKGNVFSGGNVVPFANGGIVSGPTFFGMKRGLGLMGEAGPEAILPLSRGRDGKLGVVAAGGGGGLVVHIDARGAVEGTAAQIDKVIRQRMPEIVRQSVAGVGSAKRRGVPL